MLAFPNPDPVAFSLGPLKVHWYGLMYLAGFTAGWWLGRVRARQAWRGWRGVDVDDVLFYVAIGVVVGGRLGYVLFYDFAEFMADPSRILKLWQGGMSFHGGLIGVIVAMALYARSRGRRFFEVADFIAPLVPPGLLAGRLGNFINGNLWGRETDLPWGMVFPSGGPLPRHPSQLYEAALEGLVLFVLLWWFSRRPRPLAAVSGLFLLGYGAFRFLVEFVREPDAHLGYLAFDWFTMGQALTAPMMLFGVMLMWIAHRGNEPAAAVDTGERGSQPAAKRTKRRRRRK